MDLTNGAIEADELQMKIMSVCAGHHTAIIYTAIANTLGYMETLATGEPDRETLFEIISDCMDSYILLMKRGDAGVTISNNPSTATKP